MRRPDLPLILIVLAMGAALAAFTEGSPSPSTSESEDQSGAIAPEQAYLAGAGPELVRCIRGERPPAETTGALPSRTARLVEKVSRQVERVRRLRFRAPVDARFLSHAGIRDQVSALLRKELPPRVLEREAEILELLGAIPPDIDLAALQERTLAAQVSGLYVPERNELVVRSTGEPGVVELITLAHELEHALADQSFVLRSPNAGDPSADEDLAYIAVVEGDATLTMQRYALAHIGLEEQLGGLDAGALPAGAARQFERLPDYLQRSLVFPYLGGLRIVCARWLAGGWRAVDRLYDRPPAGTDEILFPGRYGDGPAADPRDPGSPGAAWKRVAGRQLGAAELEWLFMAPGGDPAAALPQPRRLVAAWAGGELELWSRGRDRALGIALVEARGSEVLCGALAAWYRSAFPAADGERLEGDQETVAFTEPGRAARLRCTGDEVRLGIGPDPDTAAGLAG